VPTDTPTPRPVGTILSYLAELDGYTHIYTVDLDYGTRMQLTSGSSDVGGINWFPDGVHILYSEYRPNGNSIRVVDSDGANTSILAAGERQDYVQAALSPDGSQVAFFSTREGHWALYVMPSTGGPERSLTGNTVFESVLSWSPDSLQIAFTPWHNTESPPFLGIARLDAADYVELTESSDEASSYPVWSPDGSQIAYRCYIREIAQICSIKPDGSGRRQLTQGPGGNVDPAWSPDSARIAFISWRDSRDPDTCENGDCNFEIYVMASDGSHQTNLTRNPAEDWSPVWSPDGSTIAFVSLRDEPAHPADCGDTCNSEIYVMDESGEDVRRVTDDSGPSWSPAWRPLPAR